MKRTGRHPSKRSLSLDEFWEQEKDDLFKGVVAKKSAPKHNSDPALSGVDEINQFYELHKREPNQHGSFEEKLLARKLNGLRALSNRQDVIDADIHGLLHVKAVPKDKLKVESMPIHKLDTLNDDALANSLLGMLAGSDMEGLFDTKSLKPRKLKNTQERVGQRTPCQDFQRYIPIFNRIKTIIDTSKDAVKDYRQGNKISIGDVFIWGGISCFVAKEVKMEYDAEGKPNPRFKIVFDNGVYADMLHQSFSQGMYRNNGTRRIDMNVSKFLGDLSVPLESRYGKKTGEIYFLASHSTNSEVVQFTNLIKIGVTSDSTPLRTRNAESEGTYLFAPVRILKILPCYNLNVVGLEGLIHSALNQYRKEIRLGHKATGKSVIAKEWFDVELNKAVSVALGLVRRQFSDIEVDDLGNIHSGKKG